MEKDDELKGTVNETALLYLYFLVSSQRKTAPLDFQSCRFHSTPHTIYFRIFDQQ